MLTSITQTGSNLRVQHDRFADSAHRVANASTPLPDQPQQVPPSPDTAEGRAPRDDGDGVEGDLTREESVDLAREVADQIQIEAAGEAQIRLIRSQDETLGRVIDLLA